MTTSKTAFDFHHNLRRSHSLSDTNNLLDLCDSSWLKSDVWEAICPQAANELDTFIKFRDTSGDNHTVDWCPRCTLLCNDTLRTELETPQVAIHKHSVEFDSTTFVEHLLQISHMSVEDFFCYLTAASHFCPVASICSCSHELSIYCRRRHTCQQNWCATGQLSKGCADLNAMTDLLDLRSKLCPVCRALELCTLSNERYAICCCRRTDDTYACTIHESGGKLTDSCAWTHIYEPQFFWGNAPSMNGCIDICYPIHMVDEDMLSQRTSKLCIDTALLCP